MGKIKAYVQAIKNRYPELEITSAEFNPRGQYNDVLVVNGTIIFRFAKVQPAIETLHQEVIILQKLQDQISLPIPNPKYRNFEDAGIGTAFVGYPMIPGKSLWREEFRTIKSANAKARMAAQLALFLKELHQEKVYEIFSGYPNNDDPQNLAELYQKIRENLFSYMRPDARKEITEHFEKYLNHSDRNAFEPRFRHGDFGTGNILYDPESLSIAGVVDFGSAGVGDPASDFAGLYISFGEAFYTCCYEIYPEMESALDRVKFYCGIFALEEALFGLENEDENAFRAGMEAFL